MSIDVEALPKVLSEALPYWMVQRNVEPAIADILARLVPAEDEGRETIDQQANRMQRERQARVLARKPAEDEGRLRLAAGRLVAMFADNHMIDPKSAFADAIRELQEALVIAKEPCPCGRTYADGFHPNHVALAATPEPGDDMPSRHGDRFHKQ